MNELNDLIQTGAAADIRETLDFLLNECSLDETPDRETVQIWAQILQQRGGKFASLAQLCEQFLQETAA